MAGFTKNVKESYNVSDKAWKQLLVYVVTRLTDSYRDTYKTEMCYLKDVEQFLSPVWILI